MYFSCNVKYTELSYVPLDNFLWRVCFELHFQVLNIWNRFFFWGGGLVSRKFHRISFFYEETGWQGTGSTVFRHRPSNQNCLLIYSDVISCWSLIWIDLWSVTNHESTIHSTSTCSFARGKWLRRHKPMADKRMVSKSFARSCWRRYAGHSPKKSIS